MEALALVKFVKEIGFAEAFTRKGKRRKISINMNLQVGKLTKMLKRIKCIKFFFLQTYETCNRFAISGGHLTFYLQLRTDNRSRLPNWMQNSSLISE